MPEVISGTAGEVCDQSGDSDWPAITISDQDSLLVAWNAGGQLGFRTWKAGEQPTAQPAGCILPASGADLALQPRLAAGSEETFTLIYSNGESGTAAPIGMVEIKNGAAGEPQKVGDGSSGGGISRSQRPDTSGLVQRRGRGHLFRTQRH